jgi:N-acyl-D-amino-acid deacylase
MLDLVIRGGIVFDGTGAPGRSADIGIRGDRIVAVGDLSAVDPASVNVLSVTGRYVAPGFIDIHTHSDLTALTLPGQNSALQQGITTQVTGNCGLSAGLAGRGPEFNLERRGFRSDPDAADKPAFMWDSLAEHLALIEQQGIGTNYITQSGHNTIRRRVMGVAHVDPSPEQLDAMRALVRQSIEEGAVAFTTGLEYVPGRYSRLPELVALAREAARLGAFYATHLRSEGDELVEAVREALEIGRQADIPVQLSHHKAEGRENWGIVEQTLQMVEQARREGLDVSLDQYPYTAYMTGLGVVVLPAWAYAGGPEQLAQRLRDPAERDRLKAEILARRPRWGDLGPDSGWHQLVISSCRRHPEMEGRTIAQLALEHGREPLDFVLDLLAESEPPYVGVVHFAMSETDVRTVMRHPLTMIGSDAVATSPESGGPTHPRCYGTFPRVLGRYVREEGVLTWAEAIYKMTGLPAKRLGLTRRGRIQPGFAADLVIFDPATVIDRATFEQPHHYPDGIEHVLVNGVFAVREGRLTGALAGRVLRYGTCEFGPAGV